MTDTSTTRLARVPDTAATVLAAVEAIAPHLRGRSPEIEGDRRLPADVVELVRSTGVFRMGFGAEFGGPALTAAEQTRVLAALAYGDTSVGWCAMVGMDSGLFANYLHPNAVRELFPTLDESIAGMLAPAGTAVPVPGGYRVTGRWSFASGITHADWVFAGTRVIGPDADSSIPPDHRPWRVVLVPPHEVELVDRWDTTGLRGTASLDYTLTDVFVPGHRTFDFGAPRQATGPLSTPDLQMRKMPGVALGTARAALDHAREIAQSKRDKATGRPWSQDYRVQYTLGDCEARYLAMHHGVYRSLEHRWNRLCEGISQNELTADERVETALARLHAFRTAREIVRSLYDLHATAAVYRPSPFDRWLRDLDTMCQHFMAQDQIAQSAGAFLLGGTPHNPLVLGILDQSRSRR
ncbi:acyl-CoA dehydrogenase family protein [Nocardia fluminea]|uniref:acyl-CoA dehydrogenase family protein n=1 Tax=Nocardia fluminea TaxID=134984 RepID=UPI003434DC20